MPSYIVDVEQEKAYPLQDIEKLWSLVVEIMSELSLPSPPRKKDWTLTPPAFQSLLEWLDEGTDSEGEQYLEMQRRLVGYFDRKNCLAPDELADETLNRVARRLQEEGRIECATRAKYCYIVARFVFMEHLRETPKHFQTIDNLRRLPPGDRFDAVETDDKQSRNETLLSCLEQCTEKLSAANRQIILSYYAGKTRVKIENRRVLAAALGISANALTIRACRIRDRLEVCLKECVGGE